MKKLFILFFSWATVFCYSQKKQTVEVLNNSNFSFEKTIISIPWNPILNKISDLDYTNCIVIDKKTKKQVPIQLEKLGLKTIQNILVEVTVAPNSKIELEIQKGNPAVFDTKTYGRYVPERKDDFAWENNKIAFRAYGKALEGTKEDAFGYDVWVKRSEKMVINERYKIGKYHEDSGNGMDYYHVGFTLGAGNMAPFVNDSIKYSGNYRSFKVLDNGPLRTTFELEYDNYKIGNSEVGLKKIIALDANSQLNKIAVEYTFSNKENFETVAGIVKRKDKDVILIDEKNGITGYWEPTDIKYGTTGVGLVFENEVNDIKVKDNQILVFNTLKSKLKFSYYAGACWDKEGTFTTANSWFLYLNDFKNKLINPLQITLK